MIGFYIALKAKKLNEVARLQACQSNLESKQGEFRENEGKCLEPDLTLTTWHGNHASDFDEIRDADIHASYLELSGEQFTKVFDAITAKIAALQAEIASIQATIDRLLAEQAAASAQS
ncbi:DUF5082 family protein [Sporosarcina sp. 179-K 3D1 HS]|uniref:YwqH-like family protein n=1 Tax=Sporosarcina sp. 179-K 3D1 HS TaxID=3232169 RepID=UPI0039A1FC6D